MSSMAKKYAVAKTAFWIASIMSVLLLAVHVLASTQVTYYDATDLGLLTKLPITFWIGLSHLGLLLYVSRKSDCRTVIVAVLISFYLFGIPVLIRENKAEWLMLSYRNSFQGVNLLSEGHLSPLSPSDFRNWPGFYFLVAFLSSSTGLSATVLADYFPLLTIALLGVIAYSILRLQLNTLHSSLGALWFIGSFWTLQHYFCPQAIGYVMYLTILLLLAKLFFIKSKQSIAFPLSIIVLFTATVVTHLLTSFTIVVGVVAVYASCKILASSLKVKTPPFYSIATCILLASIFFSYQTLVIETSFSRIIGLLYEEISRQETHLSSISQARIIGSTSYMLELVGTYGITIISVVIAIFAILITVRGLLFHKKEVKHDVFWIAWIIVAGILGASVRYGGESIERAFMFSIVPMCYFAIKFLNKKPRILILVLIILIFIHIPADYSADMHRMVPTNELKGLTFGGEYIPPDAWWFYSLPSRYVRTPIKGKQIYIVDPRMLDPEFVNKTIGEADFIISSNLQKNYYLYYWGVDPLEHLNFDDHYNRIYDNEGFRIHARINT
jgi:hypothetical protein